MDPNWLGLLVQLVAKRQRRMFLAGTSGCYGCGKNDHKVRDCPSIAVRGTEAKKALS